MLDGVVQEAAMGKANGVSAGCCCWFKLPDSPTLAPRGDPHWRLLAGLEAPAKTWTHCVLIESALEFEVGGNNESRGEQRRPQPQEPGRWAGRAADELRPVLAAADQAVLMFL